VVGLRELILVQSGSNEIRIMTGEDGLYLRTQTRAAIILGEASEVILVLDYLGGKK